MRRLWQGLVAALVVLVVATPSDTAWADSTRDKQWYLAFLNVTEAHRYSEGEGVIVAVVDSGVDGSHPDLVGNVSAGADVEPGQTGNGWADTYGHGTAMAGLIAAHGHGPGDSLGALGIAPKATILPVKDGDRLGTAQVDGINWAVAHGAKVISLSRGSSVRSLALQRAVESAISHDIVIVAAAGNIPGTEVDYPAAYPGVVAVAGVDQQGAHADISITGPQVVLSAPAVGITRPTLNHGYGIADGTSDATAIVAGVAALVRAKYPNLSATEVVHRLTATAIDKGAPGRDDVYGYGIVNPVGALTADVPPLPHSPSPSQAPSQAGGGSKPTKTSPWLYLGIGVVILIAAGVALLAIARRRS